MEAIRPERALAQTGTGLITLGPEPPCVCHVPLHPLLYALLPPRPVLPSALFIFSPCRNSPFLASLPSSLPCSFSLLALHALRTAAFASASASPFPFPSLSLSLRLSLSLPTDIPMAKETEGTAGRQAEINDACSHPFTLCAVAWRHLQLYRCIEGIIKIEQPICANGHSLMNEELSLARKGRQLPLHCPGAKTPRNQTYGRLEMEIMRDVMAFLHVTDAYKHACTDTHMNEKKIDSSKQVKQSGKLHGGRSQRGRQPGTCLCNPPTQPPTQPVCVDGLSLLRGGGGGLEGEGGTYLGWEYSWLKSRLNIGTKLVGEGTSAMTGEGHQE